MNELNADVVVIGSGPGGEGTAMQLAKAGKKVIVCERFHRLGGGCTHWGTIPSKALRFSIFQMTEALNLPLLIQAGVKTNPSMADLRQSARSVIAKQESMRRSFYSRNEVQVLSGPAKFIDNHTIAIGNNTVVKADQVVIAVGSRPFRPEGIDFQHPRIFDSDTILDLNTKPHSMTVYGAGVIGCEYASMFRNIDVKINLVNTRARLLEFLDDEITDALSYHLRDRGALIRHNERMDRIEPRDDGVIVFLKSGKALKTDIVLWAAGRVGNTENLGLEHIGLESNKRGYLEVNNYFQTSVQNVYAVGEVLLSQSRPPRGQALPANRSAENAPGWRQWLYLRPWW